MSFGDNESSQSLPQFSVNLFAGPCFGDLTSSQSSFDTSDASSPDPLPLNLYSDPSSKAVALQTTQLRQTGDLIDLTDAEKRTPDMLISPDRVVCDSSHEHITSLIDLSPMERGTIPQSPTITLLPSTLASSVLTHDLDSNSNLPLLHDAPDLLDVSISLDEQSFTSGPKLTEQPSSTNASNTDENTFPDSTSAKLFLFEIASSIDAITRPPSVDFESSGNVDPLVAEEHLLPDSTSAILSSTASPIDAILEDLPSPADLESNGNVDPLLFPMSSPITATKSSPILSTASASHPPPNLLDPSTFLSQISQEPHLTSVGSPLSSCQVTSEPESRLDRLTFRSSPPPSSSPPPIFSSSPPVSSDFSVLDDLDFMKCESRLDSPMPLDKTNPSSPCGDPFLHAQDFTLQKQDDLIELPPSSSPISSSSQPELHVMESAEQQPLDKLENDLAKAGLYVRIDSPKLEELAEPVLSDGVMPTLNLNEGQRVTQVPENVLLQPVINDELRTSRKRKHEDEASTASTVAHLVQGSSSKSNQEVTETRKEIMRPLTCSPIEINRSLNQTVQAPNPKRPTLASQTQQRKMLAKPFRPLTVKSPKAPESVAPPPPPKNEPEFFRQPINSDLKKHRTQRAAGQFKSPLPLAVSSSLPSSIRQTPTIQALERKVQVLRRAVKLKKDNEEQILVALVKKWTEAGREVAWEIWSHVKDSESGVGGDWEKDSREGASTKRRFEDSWGWTEEADNKKIKLEDTGRNWGWDVPTTGNDEHAIEKRVESLEEDKPKETLGTMLMRLGIAPATLGWDDEQGEFVDE